MYIRKEYYYSQLECLGWKTVESGIVSQTISRVVSIFVSTKIGRNERFVPPTFSLINAKIGADTWLVPRLTMLRARVCSIIGTKAKLVIVRENGF